MLWYYWCSRHQSKAFWKSLLHGAVTLGDFPGGDNKGGARYGHCQVRTHLSGWGMRARCRPQADVMPATPPETYRLLNIYSIHTLVNFTKCDRDELMDSASLLGWQTLCSSLACCLLDLTCSKFCLSWHCLQFLLILKVSECGYSYCNDHFSICCYHPMCVCRYSSQFPFPYILLFDYSITQERSFSGTLCLFPTWPREEKNKVNKVNLICYNPLSCLFPT